MHDGAPCREDSLEPQCDPTCLRGEVVVSLDVNGQTLPGSRPQLMGAGYTEHGIQGLRGLLLGGLGGWGVRGVTGDSNIRRHVLVHPAV